MLQPRPGIERRREKRYQVDLPGQARGSSHATTVPVIVSDLSASGGLITVPPETSSFAKGEVLVLSIEQFGEIEARVVYVGHGFYGLSFINPHLHRDRLSAWLREDVRSA